MSIGSIVSRVIPAAIGFATGGPVGAAAAAYSTESQKRAVERQKDQIARENVKQQEIRRNLEMAIGLDAFGGSGRPINTTAPATQSSGGSFFDTIRGGLREVGGFTQDLFMSGIPQIFGFSRPPSVGQQPALTTVTNVGAQESQGSGSIQAGAGTLLPSIISGARSLLKTPQGQLALGGGAALVGSMFGGEGKQMRITRKMKSQARMVLNMTGGNLAATADMLGIDQNTLVMILLKRFRNDGPVVTKAALRKTKQTIRRLHNMQDVLKSITPTAAGRRRTPMKRGMTTTLIKN